MPDTSPRPFVFVLMPFDEKFDDKYQLSIKPACEEVGTYAERVDEQVFGGNMLSRIYNQIAKADLIVADMTGQNPNVFYEVGYAHALNKPVILITSDNDDIPFDLQQYQHIIYNEKLSELKEELKQWIPQRLNANKEKNNSLKKIDIYHDGKRVKEDSLVEMMTDEYLIGLDFKFDVHNISSLQNEKLNLSWSLTTSEFIERSFSNQWGFDEPIENNVIKLPNGNLLHKSQFQLDLEPNGWSSLKMHLSFAEQVVDQRTEKCSISIFAGNYVRELDFKLKLVGIVE